MMMRLNIGGASGRPAVGGAEPAARRRTLADHGRAAGLAEDGRCCCHTYWPRPAISTAPVNNWAGREWLPARGCSAGPGHIFGSRLGLPTPRTCWEPALAIAGPRQLVLQAPAPVVATALGFHYTTTERQHANTGGTWSRYPAGDHAK